MAKVEAAVNPDAMLVYGNIVLRVDGPVARLWDVFGEGLGGQQRNTVWRFRRTAMVVMSRWVRPGGGRRRGVGRSRGGRSVALALVIARASSCFGREANWLQLVRNYSNKSKGRFDVLQAAVQKFQSSSRLEFDHRQPSRPADQQTRRRQTPWISAQP